MPCLEGSIDGELHLFLRCLMIGTEAVLVVVGHYHVAKISCAIFFPSYDDRDFYLLGSLAIQCSFEGFSLGRTGGITIYGFVFGFLEKIYRVVHMYSWDFTR